MAAARLRRRLRTARGHHHDLGDYFTGDPREAAELLVDDAVRYARAQRNPYADNATALIARIT
ncbi:hypothetical protein [Streptomyces sp. bgisy082]|uniref:hypothetical protein n=1 Tax=Streptomyces sp. bgisy082 TaxID=3413776 RepID=UPI003D740636